MRRSTAQQSPLIAIQHLAHLSRQVNGKRLLNGMYSLVKRAVLSDDIGRVSRHEKAFDVGIVGQQFFGQVPAIHPRHDQIGQKQKDLVCVFPGYLAGFTGEFATSTV